jgi:hypothetical protein
MSLDLPAWFHAVFGSLQNWLSGSGVGGLAVIALGIIQFFKDWKMPKKWYAIVFLGSFFVGANYVAWHDSYAELQQYKSRQINGMIDKKFWGWDLLHGNMGVLVLVSIRNPGEPTIADHWRLKLTNADGGSREFQPTHFDDGFVMRSPRLDLFLNKKDSLGDILALPLSSGGAVRGWLRFAVDGFSENQLKLANWEINFFDVRGMQCKVVDMAKDDDDRTYFPGDGSRIVPHDLK